MLRFERIELLFAAMSGEGNLTMEWGIFAMIIDGNKVVAGWHFKLRGQKNHFFDEKRQKLGRMKLFDYGLLRQKLECEGEYSFYEKYWRLSEVEL